jgi:hypothetical protein
MKLTDKQKDFLAYASRYIEEWGRSPSFDEFVYVQEIVKNMLLAW